ncbi:MAG: methylenetetrahydrofolate reductase [NAD(P)H] [Clostridia bacterium]|nr:methylenetetrahydrofolate reductase [NAD(P)H] [Clostridia bacterium]MDE7328527.1 methylenetetrahydrofolate reductase [NAD(P)H] [Clostridia bacterium]
MKINDLFKNKKAVYSFEIFPPKVNDDISKIFNTLSEIKDIKPDYVSITYSAGGSKNSRTKELAEIVKNDYGIEPLAHLTCVNSTKEEVAKALDGLIGIGVENVLALRGDRIEGEVKSDFAYASELVEFIKSANSNIDISGACYPEGHPESANIVEDIRNLKIKVDKGVTHLNSQLFFDNDDYLKYLDMVRLSGINVPIQAGVMPLVKASQFTGIVKTTGAKLPSKISRMYAKFADDPDALMEAGIAYATDQIIDLLSSGVDGIHLYIMNNSYVAKRITENIKPIIDKLNGVR